MPIASADVAMTVSGLVSTIIPVYNRSAIILRAVDSVLAQTYRPIEIILVDDGSTDETPRVIDDLIQRHPGVIRSFRQNNAGPGAARERGRQAARGEFIQYLDSDDWLLPSKFALQVAALRTHPECAIAYGTSMVFDDAGTVLAAESRGTAERVDFLFPRLLVERWWHTHTPLFCRWISDAAGAWPNRYTLEDWELEARMGALNARLVHCGSTVSIQCHYSSSERLTEGPREAYLHNEALFLPRLHACAVLAGVPADAPEMQHFSRWCLFTARQLDALGAPELAEPLLKLALHTAQRHRGSILLYGLARRLPGLRRSRWFQRDLPQACEALRL